MSAKTTRPRWLRLRRGPQLSVAEEIGIAGFIIAVTVPVAVLIAMLVNKL